MPKALLQRGLEALPFAVSPEASASLWRYLQLLNQWNQTHNLTAVRDLPTQITHHLLDCLSVLPYLPEGDVADVGSGAGLPALIIAIMQPERRVFAIESQRKKSAFLRHAAITLGLNKVVVVPKRVEDWGQHVEVIISRAMANVNLFMDLSAHLGHQNSVWLLMKGSQVEALQRHDFVMEALPVTVPLLGAERHLLRLRRTCIDENL